MMWVCVKQKNILEDAPETDSHEVMEQGMDQKWKNAFWNQVIFGGTLASDKGSWGNPGQTEMFLSFGALSIYNCSLQCKEMSKNSTLQNENIIDGFLGKPTLLATAQETVAREWIIL